MAAGNGLDDPWRNLVVALHQRPPFGGLLHVAVAEGPERGQRRAVVGLHAPRVHHGLGEEAPAAVTAATARSHTRTGAGAVAGAVRAAAVPGSPRRPTRAVARSPRARACRTAGRELVAVDGRAHDRQAPRLVRDPVAGDVLQGRLRIPGPEGGPLRHRPRQHDRARITRRAGLARGLGAQGLRYLCLRECRHLPLPAARRDELRRAPRDTCRRNRLLPAPDLLTGHLPVVRRACKPAALERVVLPLAVVGAAVVDRHLPGARHGIAHRVAPAVERLPDFPGHGAAAAVGAGGAVLRAALVGDRFAQIEVRVAHRAGERHPPGGKGAAEERIGDACRQRQVRPACRSGSYA